MLFTLISFFTCITAAINERRGILFNAIYTGRQGLYIIAMY